ncbi:MAG TPA: LLM class F420-dependent oxidoreductase [Solirubrobacteraceae bacterium]|jgi:probable F420-dependent oxidoreductase|nr:LLM class F420-dependent oxidoreductase [Solirubrobacteraceae bacterium]
MRIGVVFPQTELGGDPGAVRAFATAASELGYAHLAVFDHVVGADPAVHRGWSGPYDIDTTFHEPFVMFGYLAAITPLELVTSILILPQRQTVLVAKQAAEIDLLTQGRFRLGVGLGWNQVEYEALGQNFSDRGARLTEQVTLLRLLWTETSVTVAGEHEHVTGAGIAPLPVQRPIPVWIGARADVALRRAGRIADGWFPMDQPGPALARATAIVHRAAAEAGRDPLTLGMEGRITVGSGSSSSVDQQITAWREAGATHLSINTMGAGFSTVDEHVAALASASQAAFS